MGNYICATASNQTARGPEGGVLQVCVTRCLRIHRRIEDASLVELNKKS